MEFKPELSVTSWFVSPLTLLVFRGIATAITWLIFLLCLLQYADGTFYFYFVFFENLSYFGLMIYFAVRSFYLFRKKLFCFQKVKKVIYCFFLI